MEKIEVQKEIVKGIKDKIHEKGFADIAQFHRMSGLRDHMAFETVRRCINETSRPVAPLTLAVIMRHLDYPTIEIKQAMQDMGDTIFSYMIPDKAPLDMQDAGLLAAVKSIGQVHNNIYSDLSEMLEIMAGMVGVDVSPHLSKMRKVTRTRTLKSHTIAEEKIRVLQVEA
jgi:hypothetical protein